MKVILRGVPQGSVVGPLFLVGASVWKVSDFYSG